MEKSLNFNLIESIANLYKVEEFKGYYNPETKEFYSIKEYHFTIKHEYRCSSYHHITIRVSPYRGEDVVVESCRGNFYATLSNEERERDDAVTLFFKRMNASFI